MDDGILSEEVSKVDWYIDDVSDVRLVTIVVGEVVFIWLVVSSDDVVLPCVDRASLDDGKLNEEVNKVEWYIDDISGWKLVREVDWVVSTDIVGSTVIVEIAGSLVVDRDGR